MSGLSKLKLKWILPDSSVMSPSDNPHFEGVDSQRPAIVIYIHGYGSSGLSAKARHYQQLFGKPMVLAPSLPTDSRLAADTLDQLIRSLQPCYSISLIGSSLGGYFAIYFADKYNLPAVLINPAIPPWHQAETLQPSLLPSTDDPRFLWQPEHFKRLANFRVRSVSDALASRLLLLQQLDDEVLDSTLALDYLAPVKIIRSNGGGHCFANIADYDQQVCRFLQPFMSVMLK